MPAVSEAQRRYVFAAKGERWARKHHFDNKGKLPERKRKRRANYKGAARKARHGVRKGSH